jgi:hypothetical protein
MRRRLWVTLLLAMSSIYSTHSFVSYRYATLKLPASLPSSTIQFKFGSQFSSKNPPPLLLFAKTPPYSYNDDAFGLVFLCGATVAKDVVFATVFLVLSALAAAATQQRKLPPTKQVPAAVAALTLIVAPIITTTLVGVGSPYTSSLEHYFGSLEISPNANAWSIEEALCCISMFYGFVLSSFTSADDGDPYE